MRYMIMLVLMVNIASAIITVTYHDDYTVIDADVGANITEMIAEDCDGFMYRLEHDGKQANLSYDIVISDVIVRFFRNGSTIADSGIDSVINLSNLPRIISPADGDIFGLGQPIQVIAKNADEVNISWEGGYLSLKLFPSDGQHESEFFSPMDAGQYTISIYDQEITIDVQEEEGAGEEVFIDSVEIMKNGKTSNARTEIVMDRKSSGKTLSRSHGTVRADRISIHNLSRSIKRMDIRNLLYNGTIDIDTEDVDVEGFKRTFAVDPSRMDFADATLTIVAEGTVLYKCRDWDYDGRSCLGDWELLRNDLLPGHEYNITIDSQDPAFAEKLEIINVQSYPIVGGHWTVEFNTTGVADLTITAANGTFWDSDITLLELRCGDQDVDYSWVNGSLFVEDFFCLDIGSETSLVLTTGAHYLYFRFGSQEAWAKNKATDPYDNVTSAYSVTLGEDGDVPTALTLDGEYFSDTGYLHSTVTDASRIYVNETDLYKISYGCTWVAGTVSHRIIMENWVRKNGLDDVLPSRQSCYIRDDSTDRDRCSNSGVLLANLTDGDYVELIGDKLQGDAGTVLSYDDCWLNIQRVRNRAVQVTDISGGQDFDGTTITVNLNYADYIDSTHFALDSNAVNVSEDGLYRIYYHACSETTGQNSRMTVESWLQLNSGNLSYGKSYSYVRETGDADRNCEQGYLLASLSAGDEISIGHRKYITEGSGATVTLPYQSWLVMEKIEIDAMASYEGAGGQSITDGSNSAITFDADINLVHPFSRTGSQIFINRTGLYEVSYGFAWQDDAGNDRVIACAYIAKNASKITPSQQCDYSRGDPEALWSSVAGNVLLNATKGEYIELFVNPIGSAVSVMPESSWLSIVRMDTKDDEPPIVSQLNPGIRYVNNSWPYSNITFSCSAIDNDNLHNISLYLTGPDNLTLSLNATTPVSGYSNVSSWTVELGLGFYTWNCVAYDETGNLAHAQNRSLIMNFSDTTPPYFLHALADHTIEYGNPFAYDINATDNYKVDTYTVNDSSFSIDSTGYLANITLLPVGNYWLNITINDTWSNEFSDVLGVNVSDTLPPAITYIENVTEQLGVPLSRDFDAYDLSGITGWSVNDTRFSIDASGIFTNATALSVELYSVIIYVFDPYSNSVSETISVNISDVPDTTPPWFDPVPIDQHSEYGTAFTYDIDAYDDFQLDGYNVNDSSFSIDNDGVLRNATPLPKAVYYLNISVNDTSSNIAWIVRYVTVSDTLPPIFTFIADVIISYDSSLGVQFQAFDYSGVSSWSVNDSDFLIDNTGYLENSTLLDLGYQYLNITVTDNEGLSNWTVIYVHVVDDTLPWFNPLPVNQYIEAGSLFIYDIDAYDDYAIDSYWLNDTNFTIDALGVIRNTSTLYAGNYSIRVSVNDSSSNENYTDIIVYATDTTPPTITYIENQTIELYSDLSVQFTAWDLSGIKGWSVDDPLFEITITGVLTNAVDLPFGEYSFIVSVNDTFDNIRQTELLVNVTEYTGNLGWNVQQGEARMQAKNTIVDINPVNTDHAFILVTISGAAAYDEPDQAGIWAEFHNESAFVLHQGVGMANSNYVGWQVIENPNLNVQHYNISFGTAETMKIQELTNRVTPENTIVVLEYATSSSDSAASFDEVVFTGEVLNSDNIRVQRDSSGTISGDVGVFVVDFNDGSTIQKGEIANVGGLTSQTYIDLPSPVDINESWVYFSHASSGAANGLDDMGIRVTNINSTRWEAVREATGGNKRMRWYVITTPSSNVQRGTEGPATLTTGSYPASGMNPVQLNKTAALISWYNTGGGTTFSNYHTLGYMYDNTHWFMRREATGNSHSVSWEAVEFPSYSLSWYPDTLDLGAGAQESGPILGISYVNSSGQHSALVICMSGNCSLIESNVSSIELSDVLYSVQFACQNTTVGNFSAIYGVSSSNFPVPAELNVSCEITPPDLLAPSVIVIEPIGASVDQGSIVNISVQVYDNIAVDAVFANISWGGLWEYVQLFDAEGDGSYNYSFSNTSAFTVYDIEFYANDTSGNENSSESTFFQVFDTQAPVVLDITPAPATEHNAGEFVLIQANVTDNDAVLLVQAKVEWIGGSQTLVMTDDDSNSIYNVTFQAYEFGRNNITIIARDYYDNVNNSESTWINVTYTTTAAIYCTQSPCIADETLIISRDSIGPTSEPNQPNTIDTCVDGGSGSYQSDESLDRISMRTLNGSQFRAGDTVEVNITAYCWSTGADDNINFIYANDSSLANWRVADYIDPCPGGAFQTVTRSFVLDNRIGIHAFRGAIFYNGASTTTCGTSGYDDHDDIEFLVLSPREFDGPYVDIISPNHTGTYYYDDSIAIQVNVSDASSIEEVYVLIKTGLKTWRINLTDYDLDDVYTGVFSKTQYIGNHSLQVFAEDFFGNINDTQKIWFMVNDTGTLVVNPLGCIPSTVEQGYSVECSANVSDINVPIDTVRAFVTDPLSSESEAVLTNVSTIYRFTYLTSVVGFHEVRWWANNTNGVFRENLDLFRVVEYNLPNVTIVSPAPGTRYNTSQRVNITVYATDDTEVDAVWALVTLPGSDTNTVQLIDQGSGIWYGQFTNTSWAGIYSIQIYANDTSGNLNSSETTWVNISYTTSAAIYCEYSPCIADSSLIISRDTIGGTQEPNQPNTIDSCSDGTTGNYLDDESVENITIRSLNGSDFRGGDTVEVNITVWCYDGSGDNVNFVYANDTSSPISIPWRVEAFTDPCPARGFNTFSQTFVLDRNIGNHAFRGIIQYNGATTATCGGGGYDDNDDLEFLVRAPRERNAPNVSIILPESIVFDINESVYALVQIYEDTELASAFINVSWSGGSEVIPLQHLGSGNFDAMISNTSSIGPYTLRVTAVDIFNNSNITEQVIFWAAKSPYHIFFGNSSGDRALGLYTEIFANYGSTEVLNVFAADSDSSFEYSDLVPIGRKTDLTSSTDDFAEMDIILGTLNRSRGFSRYWGDNTTPSDVATFVVFGRTINNVPVINSTSAGTFRTGVLWDSADGTNDEYDEGEDLVFITVYNEATAGLYGVYGYEMAVIETLDEYIGVTDLVRFYTELE